MQPRLLAVCAPFLLSVDLAAQSAWSVPVFETTLNSTAADSGPHLSFDGLTLFFASFRSGNWEIYEAARAFPGGAWSVPVVVPELADALTDDQPFLAIGNVEVFFASLRLGGAGGFDILRSTRAAPGQPWSVPAFVTELNSSGSESSFSMTADGLEAYMLTTGWGAPFAPQNAIFRATRTSTALPFGTPALVTELSNANTHRDCEISPDGLTIVYTEFISPRLKVLYSSRPDRLTPFAPPTVWTEFDTVGTSQGVFSFTRSAAGDEAILAAGFANTAGGQQLMNTRRSLYYGAGCGALALTAPAAVLGTNWDLTTSNIDPVSPLSITFFGQIEAALPLDFLGGIGCTAYVDLLLGSLAAANVGGTSVLTVPVPITPSLAGIVFKTQSVCLTLGNPLNLYTSNGVSTSLGF